MCSSKFVSFGTLEFLLEFFSQHPAHREIALEETTDNETYDPDTQYGKSLASTTSLDCQRTVF